MAFFLVMFILYLLMVRFRSYLLPVLVAVFCGALQVSSRVLLMFCSKFWEIVIFVQGLLLILMLMSVGSIGVFALILVLMVIVLSL